MKANRSSYSTAEVCKPPNKKIQIKCPARLHPNVLGQREGFTAKFSTIKKKNNE